jgi:peptidoglycan hydrolase-like protein with peptidoglycan-binding domain
VTEDVSGTLGYAGKEQVGGQLGGTLTWLPSLGSVIGRGGRLYEVDGSRRAVLMLGARPAWRTMASGVANGADIQQLEANLKALGFAPRGMRVDGHWDAKTTRAVRRWQHSARLKVDGVVDLGEAVFLPAPIRITTEELPLGAQVGPGAVVAGGTTATPIVSVALATTLQHLVREGTPVAISLPDGTSTPGKVTSIGRVATVPSDQSGPLSQGSSNATVDLEVALDDPSVAESLDQAPVTVHITSARHDDTLAVPIGALVALLEGGYAVEVVDTDGARHYVPVTLGISQDGWVEVTGDGLAPGATVVVAGT